MPSTIVVAIPDGEEANLKTALKVVAASEGGGADERQRRQSSASPSSSDGGVSTKEVAAESTRAAAPPTAAALTKYTKISNLKSSNPSGEHQPPVAAAGNNTVEPPSPAAIRETQDDNKETPLENKGSKFPVKLYTMLSNPTNHHAISWQSHGHSWKVHNKHIFMTEVCPKYFTMGIWESFIRQSNAWGFKRLKNDGPDKNSYYHEYFKRGKPELLKLIKRVLPGEKGKVDDNEECEEPDFYNMEMMPEIGPADNNQDLSTRVHLRETMSNSGNKQKSREGSTNDMNNSMGIVEKYNGGGGGSSRKSKKPLCKFVLMEPSGSKEGEGKESGNEDDEEGTNTTTTTGIQCTRQAVDSSGYCVKHGGKRNIKLQFCSTPNCTNQVQKRGLCIRHGAFDNDTGRYARKRKGRYNGGEIRKEPKKRRGGEIIMTSGDDGGGVVGGDGKKVLPNNVPLYPGPNFCQTTTTTATTEVPPNNNEVVSQKNQMVKQPQPQRLTPCLGVGCKDFAVVGFFCLAHSEEMKKQAYGHMKKQAKQEMKKQVDGQMKEEEQSQQQKKQGKKQSIPKQQKKPKLMSCLAVGCKEFAFAGFFCPAHEHLDKLQDKLCLAVGCKNERFDGYFCLVHSAKMAAASSNTSRVGSEEAVALPAAAGAPPPPPPAAKAVKRITPVKESDDEDNDDDDGAALIIMSISADSSRSKNSNVATSTVVPPSKNNILEKKVEEEEEEEEEEEYDPNVEWPLTNIARPGKNDCLFGRGGGTNHNPGNKKYRMLVNSKKDEYRASKRFDKPLIAKEVVTIWRSMKPPGRFLQQDVKTKLWNDVGDQKAQDKTSQALREKPWPPSKLQLRRIEQERIEQEKASLENRESYMRYMEGMRLIGENRENYMRYMAEIGGGGGVGSSSEGEE